MVYSVLGTKCGNWVHGRCAKIKRATARLAMDFVCSRSTGMVDLIKRCNEVETVNGFCLVSSENER